jgi:hypothetical protein
LGTGLFALLAYIISGFGGTIGWTNEIPEGQVDLALLLIGVSFLDLFLAMWFPSGQRIRNTVAGQEAKRIAMTPKDTRAGVPQATVLGSLMVGTIFADSISIYGLLLAYLSMNSESLTLLSYGYLLMLLGAIALVLQRWRATRLVEGILTEVRAKSRTRSGSRQNDSSMR